MKVVQPREDLSDEMSAKSLLESTVVPEQRRNGSSRYVLQENVEMLVVRRRI